MGVSINGGTPKWMVLKGTIPFKWMMSRGSPIHGNPHIRNMDTHSSLTTSIYFLTTGPPRSPHLSGREHLHVPRGMTWNKGARRMEFWSKTEPFFLRFENSTGNFFSQILHQYLLKHDETTSNCTVWWLGLEDLLCKPWIPRWPPETSDARPKVSISNWQLKLDWLVVWTRKIWVNWDDYSRYMGK